MDVQEAQLILKTRQYFYSSYMNYLQNCSSTDKWRRAGTTVSHIPTLFDTIEKVLTQEDIALGFQQPEGIGLRPRAVPNKFIAALNSYISWDRYYDSNSERCVCNADKTLRFLERIRSSNICRTPYMEKQFFMVYLSESTDIAFRKYTNKWLQESVGKFVGPFTNNNKLTYVIMYNKTPDQFCTIAWAKMNFGVFMLQECFKNKVPIHELM